MGRKRNRNTANGKDQMKMERTDHSLLNKQCHMGHQSGQYVVFLHETDFLVKKRQKSIDKQEKKKTDM
jgi:hypothetical protein